MVEKNKIKRKILIIFNHGYFKWIIFKLKILVLNHVNGKFKKYRRWKLNISNLIIQNKTNVKL